MSYSQPQASFLPPVSGGVPSGTLPQARGTRPPVSSRAVGAGRGAQPQRPGATQRQPVGARTGQRPPQRQAPRVQASARVAPQRNGAKRPPVATNGVQAKQTMAQQMQVQAVAQEQAQQQQAPAVKIPALSRPFLPPAKLKWGTVKQVSSGDTIVLMGQQTHGMEPAPTMQVTLTGCRAPTVARSSSGREDAWGWESREFLRRLLIGQHVQFGDEETDKWEMGGRQMSRTYATVLLNRENISETVIRAGLAGVTPMKRVEFQELEKLAATDQNKARQLHARERLIALERAAKEEGAGVHNMGPDDDEGRDKFIRSKVRSCNWPTETEEMVELFKKMEGKKVKGIVEKVEWGSSLRLELLPEKEPDEEQAHILVKCFLAGITCPRTPPNLEVLQMQWDRRHKGSKNPPKPRPTEDAPAPPFARAAQNYVEVRLLNREVVVEARCKDAYGNMFVTVAPASAPDRDISQYLLQTGLSEITAWSLRKLPQSTQQKLHQAQKQAQVSKQGIWSIKEPPKEKSQDAGRVVQVLSGDSIVLAGPDNKEFRAQLASIRAPKLGNRYDNAGPEPWALDAKEFLRCKLINQPVKVVIEYKRARDREDMIKRYGPDQIFVSLYAGERKENISLSLVNLGYAEVVRHGQNDPKADAYATMLERESSAQQQKLGKWGDGSKQRYKANEDLSVRFGRDSNNPQAARIVSKCKILFEDIKPKYDPTTGVTKEGKRIDGCVEHVFSGSRLKIAVPNHDKVIILVLTGLQSDRYSEDAKDYVKEAYAMVRNVLLQRNVKFSVEAVDRGGNFIGHIWLGNKQNLGEELLRRGLAKVRRESAERSFRSDELQQAEAQAKENKVGCWEGYDPTMEKQALQKGVVARQAMQPSISGQTVEGYSTHIADATTFYLQHSKDENVPKVEAGLKTVDATKTFEAGKSRLGKGRIVAAKYEGDFYRCRYGGRAGPDARVYFLDYGNDDVVPMDALVQLDPELVKVPSTAYRCKLAGVKPPPSRRNPQYFQAAGQAFAAMIDGKNLTVSVLYTDDRGTNYVRVLDDNGVDMNEAMVKEGHARLEEDKQLLGELIKVSPELNNDMEKVRREAFLAHNGMWEYGDPGSDTEEDDGKGRGGRFGGGR